MLIVGVPGPLIAVVPGLLCSLAVPGVWGFLRVTTTEVHASPGARLLLTAAAMHSEGTRTFT